MSDNRPISPSMDGADYNSLAAVINYQYCKKHGYDFYYHQTYYKELENPLKITTCVDISGNLRHASWAKLITALDLAKEPYDLAVYIDSDCIFKDQERTIENYIESCKNKDIIFLTNFMNGYSRDIPLPCAGFFIFKVNEKTRLFIKGWYEYILKERNTDLYWEQDALWLHMYQLPPRLDYLSELYQYKIPNRDLNPLIYVMDDFWFSEKEGQYILHVCHVVHHHRIPYFTNFINVNGFDYGVLAKEILTSKFKQLDTSTYYK
jgi:hypothetical protein